MRPDSAVWFPTLKTVSNHYEKDTAVAFLAVQTTFEGHATNTFARGKEVLKKFKLDLPFGQDRAPGVRSGIMRDFKTRGTPWTIIIDPEGLIRCSSFHIAPKEAVKLIDKLKEKATKESAAES
jgi:hypothetical protein